LRKLAKMSENYGRGYIEGEIVISEGLQVGHRIFLLWIAGKVNEDITLCSIIEEKMIELNIALNVFRSP